MKRTWIVLIISILTLILAFILFIFPGYYFELSKVASLPLPPTGTPSPPTSSSSSGSSPSSSPTKTTSSSAGPSSSASSSVSSSVSSNPSASVSASPSGSTVSDYIYNEEKRKEKIGDISHSISRPILGTSASVVAAVLLINPLLSLLFNFPFRDFFYFFFNSFFEFLGIRKRRRPWGTIYDSLLKRPVAGAIVKIVEVDSGRVRETRVTDRAGRFGFLVEKGRYRLTVVKTGYIFPSAKIKLDKNKSDGYFSSVYLGGVFSLQEGFLGKNIPLDAVSQAPARFYLLFLRFARFFERIRVPLLIIGTIIAILNLYLFRSLLDLVIILAYVLLWLYEIYQLRKVKPYGEVQDEDGTPLDLAVIRFFREDNNKLIATSITDKKGRFFVILPQGGFYLTASKAGYFLSTLKNVHISKINPREIKILMKSAAK